MHKTKNKCPLCGGLKKQDYITFTADLKETIVVIRNVPATVCSLCGNEWISDDVAGQIENIVEDARIKKHLLEVTNYVSDNPYNKQTPMKHHCFRRC